MKDFKIRTYNNDLLYDAIVLKCRSLGFGGLQHRPESHAHIYGEWHIKCITWTGLSQEDFFLQKNIREITINELFEMELSPRETIKIGGTTYDKEEFERAIKDFKPINYEKL